MAFNPWRSREGQGGRRAAVPSCWWLLYEGPTDSLLSVGFSRFFNRCLALNCRPFFRVIEFAMRPLVATIDLAALRHNYAVAHRRAPGRGAVAGVEDADGFGVCCLEEARAVREANSQARLLLLEGCFQAAEYVEAADLGLDVAVHNAQQAQALLSAELSQPLNVWLKLDSGMHRLGFSPAEVREWHGRLSGTANVAELNLLGHFACADERGHELNEQQIETFLGLLDLNFDQRSLANSAALLTIPAAHMDWQRPGIMLYGATPF